jgi:hypothetical protein
MMFSYHSISDLEKSILDFESETSHPTVEYICCKDIRYIFYILYLLIIILFLIFIIIIITNYTVE